MISSFGGLGNKGANLYIIFLSNGICSAVILNIHIIFSIIELVSIKRLTEVKINWLLIIDACRDTWSINKILCSLWVLKLGANDTSDS